MSSPTTSKKNVFRPRACSAGKKEKFGVAFDAIIQLEDDLVAVQPSKKIVGEVVVITTEPIKCREMIIQFEVFLAIPTSQNYKGSVAWKRQSIFGRYSPGPDGYQQSPVRQLILEDLSIEGQIIAREISEMEAFPFTLTIPRSACLPTPFEVVGKGRFIIYRLSLYMKSPYGTYVEVAEKVLECFELGYYNLYYNQRACRPVLVEKSFQPSLAAKKWATATLSLKTGGFLLGEKIPFVFSVKSRMKVLMELEVFLEFGGKLGKYSMISTPVPHTKKKKSVKESVLEYTWEDELEVPPDAAVSFNSHPMLKINNVIQFRVKFLGSSMNGLSGSAPIYIGTTREPPEGQAARDRSNSLLVPVPPDIEGRERSSSVGVADRRGSMLSLPPPYSQLSSRAQSWETLPPDYSELWAPGETWEVLQGGILPPAEVEEGDYIHTEQG